MPHNICITGYGVITALGNNAHQNFSALKQGRHGVSKLELIESIHKNELLVGEIKLTNDELKAKADLKKVSVNTRGTLLAIIAVKEAIKQAKLTPQQLENTALISGTSVGGMDLFEQGFKYVVEGEAENPQYYFSEHDCGNLNLKIATEMGLKSYATTISTACSSSANAILLGAKMIKAGMVERAIVGGSDALSKFTINGFNTLGILDTKHTQPFDENRAGLNLGEGAGYLVIESEKVVANKEKLGYITGWGNANDAFHQTASSEEAVGAKMAIEKALKVAQIKPQEIDYINTHGTGTPNNDESESKAIIDIFGKDKLPVFNSLKPFTGHTLAACGSIETIYSLFSMNENMVFPSLNFKTPIKGRNLEPTTKLIENKEIKHVLSNSLGFGGNCTSLIISKKA